MLLTKTTSLFRIGRISPERSLKVRQYVIDSLGEYLAELSFIAFHEFAEQMAERIAKLPVNRKWDRLFKQYQHKISSKGVYEVADEIMLDLEKQMA